MPPSTCDDRMAAGAGLRGDAEAASAAAGVLRAEVGLAAKTVMKMMTEDEAKALAAAEGRRYAAEAAAAASARRRTPEAAEPVDGHSR